MDTIIHFQVNGVLLCSLKVKKILDKMFIQFQFYFQILRMNASINTLRS